MTTLDTAITTEATIPDLNKTIMPDTQQQQPQPQPQPTSNAQQHADTPEAINKNIIVSYEHCAQITENLAILGNIEQNDKLMVTVEQSPALKFCFQLDKPSLLQPLWRYWYGASRDITIKALCDFAELILLPSINGIVNEINIIHNKSVGLVKATRLLQTNGEMSSRAMKRQCKEIMAKCNANLAPYFSILSDINANITKAADGIHKLETTYINDAESIQKIQGVAAEYMKLAAGCTEIINKHTTAE